MIYKIPIYIEILSEGDFNPSGLSQAVDSIVAERVNSLIRKEGSFPYDSETDMFDPLAERVRSSCGAKRIKVKLIDKSHVLEKLSIKNRK